MFRRLMSRVGLLLPYQAGLAAVAHSRGSGETNELKIANVDYPAEYLNELAKKGLVEKDPVVNENFKTFRLQYWGDTFKRTKRLDEAGPVFSLAEDFGFSGVRSGIGYAHGVRNAKGTEGSFFCWHGLHRSRRTEEILRLIVPHLHEALCRAVVRANESLPLTPRELEVLKWLSLGKSTWDISVILGIAERTVKFHVGNLLEKLDASTRAHAVAVASARGWIDIE
ncbi:helix-turn-helix transcriptional regulator [Thiohalomonas denitrificans]|uniref:helix-turn-helix transcriptional regulator n=1 Tax=Thiohalomonas denitrificans TaxID=415747 RepID=UPI0026E976D0|nr:LuxR family transcriptional regulator [Thiohalomonas denitrificans]